VGSWLCVGLDPDLAWLPPHLPHDASGVSTFCREIVEATGDVAVCFKINFAFFEALGPDGWEALAEVRESVPPAIPVIADAKRGDIGNTDEAYAHGILDVLRFDAVTVSPYLGSDSVSPFAARPGRCALVLCKTSNPGAAELQDLEVSGDPLYLHVARRYLGMEVAGEFGFVVGATQPQALKAVRSLSSDVILLVPGVGAQGATADQALQLGANDAGENALIAVSRQILCASPGRDYARAAATVARELSSVTGAPA
jgi:orotidine-5'-phosphate decarboxylase